MLMAGNAALATDAYRYYYDYPDFSSAKAACDALYNKPSSNDCAEIGQLLYRQCNLTCEGSAGPGVKICKAWEQLYTDYGKPPGQCTNYESYSEYFFRYPTNECPAGTVYVGPTAGSCAPIDASVYNGPANDPALKDVVALGKGAGLPESECSKGLGFAPSPDTFCTLKGNPINTASGNKLQVESDFVGGNGVPGFARFYNSSLGQDYGIGPGWSHSYSNRLEFPADGVLYARRPDGKFLVFRVVDGVYIGDADVPFTVTRNSTTERFTLSWPDGRMELYEKTGWPLSITDALWRTTNFSLDGYGRVATVTGPYGHQLTFTYRIDDIYRVNWITFPDGKRVTFTYDASKRLTAATYTGVTPSPKRTYAYSGGLLSGLVDETNVQISSFSYDSQGNAKVTTHPGDVVRFDVAYGSGIAIVTDAVGTTETLSFVRSQGVNQIANRTSSADGKSGIQAFDANNNLLSQTDEEGRTTTYTWDTSNRLVEKVEASGTPEALITTYSYRDATSRQLALVDEPSVLSGASKTTTFAYDGQNRPVGLTVTGYAPSGAAVARTISWSYAVGGQVASISDSKGQTVALIYGSCTAGGACGQLSSVTNPAGQVTTFGQYDANGRLLRKTDPNGLVTTYTYNLRGKVLSVTETPVTGGARTFNYTWDAAGRLLSAVLPGRGTLTYTYDAADRLASVTDSLGNKVTYSYDLKGNRTQDVTRDPNGTVVRQVDLAFNARNYPSQVNAAGSVTQLVHDAVGNLTQVTDPNGNVTQRQPDALDRVIHTIDAIGGMTEQEFDGGGNLAGVVTPNSAETRFEVDDLGNVLKETSPDRGVITYTHDANGNMLTRADARGITATFTYDVLNRVTSIVYPNSAENVAFAYDNCPGGVGRLCWVTDANGTRSWSYDGFGRVTSETWVKGGTSKTTFYTWTPGDDLASITYPSGRTVAYTRNAIGNVTAVSTNGSTILTGRTYRADGLVKGQTWANGIAETKAYDLQGRLTTWTSANLLNRTFAYDANGNVVQKDASQFQYDLLDRLIGEPGQILGYDGNGNRLLDGAGPYSYTPASNRMATGPPGGVTLDAAGNTLAYAGQTYAYNQAGKLVSATVSGQTATYAYRHDGLRANKTVAGITTYFHYDLDGRLIAETDAAGVTLREYVWDDAVPVAQIAGGVVTYLHTDQLGTPRLGTNSAGAQVWAWDSDAFGSSQPTGTVTVNLRFPGQYFDAETGLHQNWNRTYHPLEGRYLESDPIGLAGGVNTYGYVEQNPLLYADPLGLAKIMPGDAGSIGPGFSMGGGVGRGGLGGGSAGRACDAAAKSTSNPAAYSVAFETSIARAGVGKRGAHFTDANRRLAEAMKKDPGLEKTMNSLGIKIPQRLDQSPANWTWHHVTDQPGILQLVPRFQHQGSQWQPLLHPNKQGGFKRWGADY